VQSVETAVHAASLVQDLPQVRRYDTTEPVTEAAAKPNSAGRCGRGQSVLSDACFVDPDIGMF